MDENYSRKVIIMSLAGLLIGSLLFIFGISINSSILPMIIYYIIAISLYLSSFLATYNQYKKQKQNVFLYILCLDIVLFLLISIALLSHL